MNKQILLFFIFIISISLCNAVSLNDYIVSCHDVGFNSTHDPKLVWGTNNNNDCKHTYMNNGTVDVSRADFNNFTYELNYTLSGEYIFNLTNLTIYTRDYTTFSASIGGFKLYTCLDNNCNLLLTWYNPYASTSCASSATRYFYGWKIDSVNVADKIKFDFFPKYYAPCPSTDYTILGLNFIYLNVSSVVNFNNSLPNVSIDYNKSICYDKTSDYINQNLTLHFTSFDNENDTIVYATEVKQLFSSKSFYYQDFIDYSRNIIGIENCAENYDFFSSQNFVSNYSYNTEGLFSNPIKTNYEFRILRDSTPDFVCKMKLVWYEGIDLWRFKTDYRMPYGSSNFIQYSIPKTDTIFSNIFYDSSFNSIVNITFNYTDEKNLTLFIDGTFVYSTNYTQNKDFFIRVDINNSVNAVEVYLIGNEMNLYTTSLSHSLTDFNYIDFSIPKNVIGAVINNNTKEIDIKTITTLGRGSISFPVFSSNIPNSISFNSTGNYYYTIYYTDSLHQSINQYKSILVQFNVFDCAGYVNPDTLTQTDMGSITEAFKILGGAEYKICKTLDTTPIYIGLSWCIIFFVVSVIIQIALTIFIHMIHRDFNFSLIVFGFWGFFFQYLVYTPLLYKIIEAFIVTIGFMTIIFKVLSGGSLFNRGGNNNEVVKNE